MCGIVGYVGSESAAPILRSGLKNLEYRGYDSAGVALLDGTLEVAKRSGTVDDLDVPESAATCGIGHTRWSTHGAPSDANAHPHTDCTGQIAVVHNGIVDNYDALQADLADHAFTSETDTEVVAHLLERVLELDDPHVDADGRAISYDEREQLDASAADGPDTATASETTEALDGPASLDGAELARAVERVVEQLEGSFALGVCVRGCDGIVAARNDSPLVIGHGEHGHFLGSDVTAFLEHTRDVTYLEDGDVAHVTADGVTITNGGEAVDRPVETVEWEADAAEKGGYEHYMRKEIHEQPQALRQALSGRVDSVSGRVDLDVSLPEQYCNSLEEIQLVACGTSYHAGLYAARLFERQAGVRATVEIASEYAFESGRDPWRTLVVAITQSGETADTLGAMRRAARAGAQTLAVTNTVGSTAAREADHALYIRAGPEIGVAATKTFASQVATLALLAIHVGRVRGDLSSTAAGELLDGIRGLPGAIQQVLDDEDLAREVAEVYGDGDAFFFLGRSLGYPVALEAALKLKEIAYVHAEGFAAGELKHGPLALVTEDTPVFAVLTDGADPSATLNNVKEVESRGAPVIGVSSFERAEKYLDVTLPVPDVGPFEPLVANVYLQLVAYHVADGMGRSIDKPRNLAKSVTVE